jgi:hypothetical protein
MVQKRAPSVGRALGDFVQVVGKLEAPATGSVAWAEDGSPIVGENRSESPVKGGQKMDEMVREAAKQMANVLRRDHQLGQQEAIDLIPGQLVHETPGGGRSIDARVRSALKAALPDVQYEHEMWILP